MTERLRIIIAAGGTGGHLFPGIAIAERLKELGSKVEVTFIGSDRSVEREIVERNHFSHESLTTGRLKGEGLKGQIQTMLRLPKVVFQARHLLKRLQPDVVFGIGGYTSGPVILGAVSKAIPTAILEPNSIPGFTNRMLSRWVKRVFVAFPETIRFFPRKKTRLTGTPVRQELTEVGGKRDTRKKEKSPFHLLVVGGSQGSTALNQAMVGLLPRLAASGRSFQILHQTGEKDFEWVREAYDRSSVPHTVYRFIEDMTSAYREADLAISRAGASTIAEVIATRTPAILVPYPFAADDHQRSNALSVVEGCGAEMILNKDLDRLLGDRILFYEGDREELRKRGEKLGQMQKVPAAEMIARELLELHRGSRRHI